MGRILMFILILVVLSVVHSRQYQRCEVVKFLRSQKARNIPTWTCLAKHESEYVSHAKGGPNKKDGSFDHGLWQINDDSWCYNEAKPGHGNDCKVRCSTLRGDNLTPVWKCAQKVYSRHKFSAWTTYKYCKNAERESKWTAGC